MRKTWQKPKLVVLVRGRPEEFVLAACKGAVQVEPIGDDVNCRQNAVFCQDCSALGDS